MVTRAAKSMGTLINHSLVAENSHFIVDQINPIVSKDEANRTTSYNFNSFWGSFMANNAPTPLMAISDAPRFLNHAIFSKFAPSISA